MEQEQTGCIIAVRVRGSAGLRHQVEAILKELGLNRRYQAILLTDSPAMRSALKRAKDALFWGKASGEILTPLLSSRSRLAGSGRLTDAEAKKRFGIENVKALAELISKGDLKLQELKRKGLSTRFNLHSPKRGFVGSLRNPFGKGGELGFRAESFPEIIERMI